MSATVRALILYPWRHNSSANFTVLFDDQRNGDIGSPRVAGSTSRSSSFNSPGFCSALDFLPPPAFRPRSGGTSCPSSSRTALCSVVRLNPVARATVAIPPCPRNRASAAATNRRCRSFRYGFKRACFAPNPESSAMTVSYIFPARKSSLFLRGYLGIGANTAIFSVADAALFRTLPVAKPEQLDLLTIESSGSTYTLMDSTDYRALRQPMRPISAMIARFAMSFSVAAGAEASRAKVEFVSGNYFTAFGVGALAGRVLPDDDDRTPLARSEERR